MLTINSPLDNVSSFEIKSAIVSRERRPSSDSKEADSPKYCLSVGPSAVLLLAPHPPGDQKRHLHRLLIV
jgi:hypothetical protein